jgi:site-specific DNA recombinase
MKQPKQDRNGARPRVRCAVYTRKSTEEGLDQEFNSLDAQREAAQAYIASQRHEGWICLKDPYDDGGYTGAHMQRPALQRLLADMAQGKIDCVVVYKVDRLSRSLLDFARLMESFDKHQVSFVSVTQQFNTATSMGRLVLNVLLSFAQFEREIISERTRDKIAASRRKGKWSGGMPILGYDVHPAGSRLVVNVAEAERVRAIFALYLERRGLLPVVEELARRGWHNKRWTTRKGRLRGGSPFTKTTLHKLLTNPVYVGKVRYKQEVHDGEHEGIMDAALWQEVQALLRHNHCAGPRSPGSSGALLKGLLRCQACGCAMISAQTVKHPAVRYRYYVCLTAQKRGYWRCPKPALPAREIERFVLEQIRSLAQDPVFQDQLLAQAETWDTQFADLCDEEDADLPLALALLEPAWDGLTVQEQARALRWWVEKIDFDGANKKVAIAFHSERLHRLAPHLVPQPEEVP